jgi:plastocyanin
MINIGQVVVGVILLLVVVGGLLYIFYSRSNAVEKTGYGALIMLALISLMIPVFWIMEGSQQANAQVQQYTLGVQRGLALYAQYCTNNCYSIKNGKVVNPTYNGFTIDQLNQMSDSQLMRVISAGIYAPGVTPPSANLLVESQDYGGPLSSMDVQYLFDFLRSADPDYLKKNGYPNQNGFDQLVSYLQSNVPAAYASAVALGSVGNFGTPVDMTNQKAITIDILDTVSGQNCQPSCFQYPNVKVKVGTKITWVNKSTVGHTVTASTGESTAASALKPDESIFDSAGSATSFNLIQPGQSFTYTVTQAAYNLNADHMVVYYCKIHPMMVAALTIVQ